VTEETAIQMTASGKLSLENELVELKEQRPGIVARIAAARGEGDLSENFAYHDARQELGMLDGRVLQIEATLKVAVVVEAAPSDGTVGLGSKVKVRDDFGESDYTIVGITEANPGSGLISDQSPLGGALIGQSAGASVEYESPGGLVKVTIVSVS
jgi:transcription elongation factor GreA